YFKNKRIIINLLLSIITGVVLMGVIFIPQFCENAMKMAAGSGGYFVIILGVFAGIGAPLSGNLIDRYGAKVVLLLGFGTSIAGAVFLIFVTTNSPTMVTVILCLILLGTGMGFTMGTPLNYMMLEETSRKEANSALATLSLVRSMGTVIAPAIMVGFIAHAGMAVQGNIMDLLPKTVDAPGMPGNQMEINLSGSSESIPKDLLELMQGSDVTTVVENSKTFAGAMFDQMETRLSGKLPPAAAEAMEKSFALSKEKYLNAIDEKSDIIETEFQKTLNVGFKQIYGTVGISSLVGVVLLLFYRRKKKEL
ncbi:MAG: MFS transporter, partial [Anaerovoracaceae bacterium]